LVMLGIMTAANIPRIATTMISSIKVKPFSPRCRHLNIGYFVFGIFALFPPSFGFFWI
jgi:hypothetical protein